MKAHQKRVANQERQTTRRRYNDSPCAWCRRSRCRLMRTLIIRQNLQSCTYIKMDPCANAPVATATAGKLRRRAESIIKSTKVVFFVRALVRLSLHATLAYVAVLQEPAHIVPLTNERRLSFLFTQHQRSAAACIEMNIVLFCSTSIVASQRLSFLSAFLPTHISFLSESLMTTWPIKRRLSTAGHQLRTTSMSTLAPHHSRCD